jgi:hypothetical protein
MPLGIRNTFIGKDMVTPFAMFGQERKLHQRDDVKTYSIRFPTPLLPN